jgi:sporulation protein YlmC with PRC-barrel domain
LEDDVDIVRDVLDKEVVDRNGRLLGRVDGVILDIHATGARVAALEIGLIAVAQRVHPFVGRCAKAIETVLGIAPGRPVRIPFDKVIAIETNVKVDLAAKDTPVLAFEELVQPLVNAIPGAK